MSVNIPGGGRAILATAMIVAITLVGCGDSETAAEKARREAEDAAWYYCRKAVRSASKFPSESDFPWGSGRVTQATGGGYLVAGDVKLMNAFGAMITHRYVCRYKDGRALLLSLGPG